MQVAKPKKGYKLVKTSFGKYEEIPEEWEVTKFEKIIKLEYGFGLTANERKGNEFPVYGSGGISGYHSQYKVDAPGIIVARKGSLGKVHYSEKDFWPIDTVFYISKKETEQDLCFLYYLLQNLHLEKLQIVTSLPGISRNDVYGLRIFKPPLPEQKQISSILSNVDDTLQKTNQIIEQTQRLKKGMMQKLLTRGIGHTKFKKVKWLYGKYVEIPEEWDVVKIGQICESIVSGRNRPKKFVGDIPWITLPDIDSMYVRESKSGLQVSTEEIKR